MMSLCTWLVALAMLQDPYRIAPNNYRIEFENSWTRVSRVLFNPGEKIPVHEHPAFPTVYVYLTDAGVTRFRHITPRFQIDRPAVKAGALRYNKGTQETHAVEYLGKTPSEYLRVELKTPVLDPPQRDVRWTPEESGPFENQQIRIRRVSCNVSHACKAVYPSVAISIARKVAKWISIGQELEGDWTLIEFKTNADVDTGKAH